MKGFEDQGAAFFKANGIEYLKVDSCAGHDLNGARLSLSLLSQCLIVAVPR